MEGQGQKRMVRARLTEKDVRRLLRIPSEQARSEATAQAAQVFEANAINPAERNRAGQLVRLIAQDAAERVRGALSESLRHSSVMPRDVALKLAKDVESVALPILSDSPVLQEVDLIQILRTSSEEKQKAIAGRSTVSAALSHELITYGERGAVKTVLENEGATIVEKSYTVALDRFSEDSEVTRAMAFREDLPVHISEKLISIVTGEVREYLLKNHGLSTSAADELLNDARERATTDLVAMIEKAPDVRSLVTQLSTNERLTDSLCLRAACLGQIRFLEYALAERARLPLDRAWVLIHDAGPLGLRAIYQRAKLSKRFFPAFRTAIEMYHDTEFDGLNADRKRFVSRLLERILTRNDDMADEDLDYLITKITHVRDTTGSLDAEEDLVSKDMGSYSVIGLDGSISLIDQGEEEETSGDESPGVQTKDDDARVRDPATIAKRRLDEIYGGY